MLKKWMVDGIKSLEIGKEYRGVKASYSRG